MKIQRRQLLIGLFCFICAVLSAQVLDSENKLSLTLKDGSLVTLYGRASDNRGEKTKEYYYLPNTPKLSTTAKGHPAFLFQRYTTESPDDDYSGAIMHFLMEWGLDADQRKEIDGLLAKGVQGAEKGSILRGAVDVTPAGDQSFQIISGTLSGKDAPKIIKSGSAPIQPGTRIAAAAKMNAKDAQLMAATFEGATSIADLSIELYYKYTVLTPAVKGRIVVNWSRMYEQVKKDSLEYEANHEKKSRGGLLGGIVDAVVGKKTNVATQNYDEVRSSIDSLVNAKVIDVQFDEYVADERVAQIREIFMEFFMDQITNTVAEESPPPPGKREKEAMPNIRVGKEYSYNREYLERSIRKDSQVYNLNYRLPVEKLHSTSGNLADWYQSSKSNRYCVPNTIVLNDPDFEHREITVILDGEVEQLTKDKELNFVNVKVRKIRKDKDANDFNEEIVFSGEELAKYGNKQSLTYSKAASDKPDVYDYKILWSFKGGQEYVQHEDWEKGEWEGITLTPPLTPETIKFTSDKDELKKHNIQSALLQIKYSKFGKIVDEEIELDLFGENKPLKKVIYRDKEAKGFVYRLVFAHKKNKYIVTDWENNITKTIYAFLPEELVENEPTVIEELFEQGKKLLKKTAKEVEEDILDRYKDWVIKG